MRGGSAPFCAAQYIGTLCCLYYGLEEKNSSILRGLRPVGHRTLSDFSTVGLPKLTVIPL